MKRELVGWCRLQLKPIPKASSEKEKKKTLVGSHFLVIALIFRELLCKTA